MSPKVSSQQYTELLRLVVIHSEATQINDWLIDIAANLLQAYNTTGSDAFKWNILRKPAFLRIPRYIAYGQ